MTRPSDEAEFILAGRGMPRHARTAYFEYAAVATAGCAAMAASLVVAPDRAGLLGGVLALLMFAIAFVDARAYIIPDKLTVAALLLALAQAFGQEFGFEGIEGASASVLMAPLGMAILRAAALAAGFLGLREIYRRLRGREGIGLGDVKLAAVAGAWLDWALIPIAIEIATLSALAVYGVGLLVRREPFSATAKLPFGLFFAPAIWFCWLLQALLPAV